MQKIKYDNALMKLMSFFEAATKARLKDCFVDQNGLLVFVVEPAQYGLAVGKAGSNVKRVEAAIKRKIKSDFPPIYDWWYMLVENQGLRKPTRAPEGRACRWSVTSGGRFPIDIVEYSDDLVQFVGSLIQPSKAKDISVTDGVVTITPEPGSRGYLIGRAGRNLRNMESIIQRYFPVKEVRVA